MLGVSVSGRYYELTDYSNIIASEDVDVHDVDIVWPVTQGNHNAESLNGNYILCHIGACNQMTLLLTCQIL